MIQTEHTPNPNTLKFLPGKDVSNAGPVEFLKNDKNIKVPLADKILSLQGTTMVFFGKDFITVKKEDNIEWDDLKHEIISEINDHYLLGNNVVIEKSFQKKDINLQKDESNEIINKIKEVLDSKIRPAVARDGGDKLFKSYREQLLHLAKLYGVVEIKSYAKSAKRLTISQLELLLIKNNIKLPINRSSDRAIAKEELRQNTITNAYLSVFIIFL